MTRALYEAEEEVVEAAKRAASLRGMFMRSSGGETTPDFELEVLPQWLFDFLHMWPSNAAYAAVCAFLRSRGYTIHDPNGLEVK